VLSAHLPRRAARAASGAARRPYQVLEVPAGHLEDRALWDDFQRAYGDAIERCSSAAAPWYVVPADRKWYRNWAISRLLCERLEELGLGWPAATFDVDEQKALLGA